MSDNLADDMDSMSLSSPPTTPRGQGTNVTVAPNAPERPVRQPRGRGAVGRNLNLTFTGSQQMPGGKYRKRRRKLWEKLSVTTDVINIYSNFIKIY